MANLDLTLPNLKLNDGNSMPMLGYGTGTAWYKTGEESKIDQAIIDAVKMAIKMGYTHLDGAESAFTSRDIHTHIYNKADHLIVYKTESELGTAIKESGVAREKLFVTTKVDKDNMHDIEAALQTSLKKLQLDYVDLYVASGF
jgi:diketogulonate reductase-like aldo/keto reductase